MLSDTLTVLVVSRVFVIAVHKPNENSRSSPGSQTVGACKLDDYSVLSARGMCEAFNLLQTESHRVELEFFFSRVFTSCTNWEPAEFNKVGRTYILELWFLHFALI